jgi:fumarate hydratase class II
MTGRKTRVEKDALGQVEVDAERLWGAQTERSRRNFVIGAGRFRWGRREGGGDRARGP